MNRFRSIFAAFLAILIVSPVCCCAGMVRQEKKESTHSCCEAGKKEKKESACACTTKSPRVSEKHSVPTDAPVFSLPEPAVAVLAVMAVPAVETEILPERPPVDTGPQRRRLVMLQRFLI